MDIRPRLLRRIGLFAVAASLVLCPVIGVSSGHASAVALVSSTPADGAVLVTSPAQLSITFDQPIGSAFSMQIVCNGTPPPYAAARLSNATTLIIDLAATPLPKGKCAVAWRVQGTSEAGVDTGNFAFSIQQDTVVTQAPVGADAAAGGSTATTAPSSSTGSPSSSGSDLTGPLGLFRLLSTIALASLFGALVLITVAWPEGVEYILTIRFLRYSWIVASVSTWIMVACIVAQLKGSGLTGGLVPTRWGVMTHSTPGIAVLARFALVVASGWVAIRPERVIDTTTQLAALAIPGMAVATFGFSRTGGSLEIVGYAAGMGHALAMSVWFGGLVLLARVVLAGPGEDDLVHAVRGFGRLAGPAVTVTVLTGLVQVYRLDRGHLLDTTHGRLVLLKTVPVMAMIFILITTRQFVRARLARAESLSAPLAGKLRRAVGMEALVGVVVLAITSWMLSTQPANLSANAQSAGDFAFSLPLTDATGKLDATIFVAPAKVGPNAVLIEIRKPISGISNFIVRFDPPPNAAVSPVVMTITQFPAGVTGWYLPLDVGLPLPAAGAWQITLDLQSTAGPFHEGGVLSVVSASTSTQNIPIVTQPPVTSPVTTTTPPATTLVPGG